MPVAVLRHPTSSRQVGGPGSACPIWLACRIYVKDDQGNLAPIRPLGIRIKQAQICHEVLLVVTREGAGAGGGVRYRRVKWWRLHVSVPTKSTTLPSGHAWPRSSGNA